MKKKIFLLLLVLFFVSGCFKYRLPFHGDIVKDLYEQPKQIELEVDPFTVKKEGMTYRVQPLYSYDLKGLIVSDHETGGWLDYYHSQWKDSLNIKDVCVVWGDNLTDDNFRDLTYRNGSWTCYVKTPNRKVWNRFNGNELSNNHLLVDDEYIAETLLKAKRGDQIALKGYLSEYSHGEGFKRGTSISREDMGGTACETIFLTDFKILKKGNVLWSWLSMMSKWGLMIIGLWGTVEFFKPEKRPRRKSNRRISGDVFN